MHPHPQRVRSVHENGQGWLMRDWVVRARMCQLGPPGGRGWEDKRRVRLQAQPRNRGVLLQGHSDPTGRTTRSWHSRSEPGLPGCYEAVFIQVKEHILFNNLSVVYITLKYNGKKCSGFHLYSCSGAMGIIAFKTTSLSSTSV